jgi:hypothetical protein
VVQAVLVLAVEQKALMALILCLVLSLLLVVAVAVLVSQELTLA